MTKQLYAKNHGRLEKFLEANSDTFLLQEIENGPMEVLFISAEEGGAEASKGNASDVDVGTPGEDAGEFARGTELRWWVVVIVGGDDVSRTPADRVFFCGRLVFLFVGLL